MKILYRKEINVPSGFYCTNCQYLMSKKKRKFRAMTVGEWCDPSKCSQCEYHYNLHFCSYAEFNRVNRALGKDKPYKTKNGKYIFIEVTNDA